MIDFETLATTPDAVAVSLGAVIFSPSFKGDGIITTLNYDDHPLPFSVEFHLEEQLRRGRRVSGDTLRWWMQQPPEARKVFASDQQLFLQPALGLFNRWLPETSQGFDLWANGADFDIPILLSLYEIAGVVPVHKFYQHRCFRTLKELHPKLYEAAKKKHQNPVKHDALQDALWQARVAVDILRKVA